MKNKKEQDKQGGTAAVVKSAKKKKLIIVLVIIAAVIAAVVGNAVHNMTQTVELAVNTIEIEPVQLRDLSDTISLKGTIAGSNSVNVMSQAVAEITAMNVQVGDVVSEGDVLCTLDSAAIQENLTKLEQSVSNADAVSSINSQQTQVSLEQVLKDQQTQLAEAEKAVEDAQGTFDWTEMQYNSGAVDFSAYHSAKRALESAQTAYDNTVESTNRAVESARIQIQLDRYKDTDSTSKESLDDLRKQLRDCEVTAPCSGVVTSVNMRVGDMNTAKTTIITIEDTSSLKVAANVDEADILKLAEGMKAVVTADATGEEEIDGTITRVVRVKGQPSGTDSSALGYSIEITIDNQELLIGMAAKAKVMIQEKGKVLAVPYDLIQYDENGQAFVLVAKSNEDGSAIAVRKNIEAGEEVDYYTEITGGELQEGDMLIYDYTYSVVEGQTFMPEQMYSNQSMDLGTADDGMADTEGAE